MGGDRNTVSLTGLHLLGELADRVGLTGAYSAAVPPAGERPPTHDRGRLLVQVALMLAGGGRCVADLGALRDQPGLFGEVASAPTVWRTFNRIDAAGLDALRAARAQARRAAWAAGGASEQVVLDVDASLVEIHSENKEQAASHFKRGYGFHPMFCVLDDGGRGEALAGVLRAGNAAANSGADQLAVVDMALTQLPESHRRGHRPGDAPDALREQAESHIDMIAVAQTARRRSGRAASATMTVWAMTSSSVTATAEHSLGTTLRRTTSAGRAIRNGCTSSSASDAGWRRVHGFSRSDPEPDRRRVACSNLAHW
jgi:hypothetical protein